MAPKVKTPRNETAASAGPLWSSEPFRVFFPAGVLASLVGVLLWPLFYSGLWQLAPNLMHPRIMIFGFGGAFLCGFLGTAWPRFLEAEALLRSEVLILLALWAGAMGGYLTNQIPAGDLAAGLFLLALLVVLCRRLRKDRDLPPPGFALAMLSVALACTTALLWAWSPAWLFSCPEIYLFTRLFAYQGMLMLPLLGVGSYLFARFFQVPGGRPPNAPPGRRAFGVWFSAALFLLSLGIEAYGMVRTGSAVRLLALLCWAALAVPAIWRGKAPTTRAWALRISFGAIATTYLVRSFWPGPGYALAHLLFVGGFGLALLLVADRVSHGHGGEIAPPHPKSRPWRWLVWLAVVAAATRASADIKSSIMVSHHIYAALFWAAVLGLWTWKTGPLWRKH